MLDHVHPDALGDEGAQPGKHLMKAWIAGKRLKSLGSLALVRADASFGDLLIVKLLLHAELVGSKLFHIDLEKRKIKENKEKYMKRFIKRSILAQKVISRMIAQFLCDIE